MCRKKKSKADPVAMRVSVVLWKSKARMGDW